jgi:hypothetical protein
MFFCSASGSQGRCFRVSLQLGIIVLRVARCYTIYFFYRGLTGLQLIMQQGNERTRVKSRTSRLDSRALDGSKTNRLIHMLLRTYKPFRVYHSPYLLHRHTLDAGRIVYVKLIPRTQLTASCQLLRSLRCLE